MSHSSIVGYACINETLAGLRPASTAVKVNRGMIKKTFSQKGLVYAGQLALQNLYDLEKIIRWNYEHDVKLYRMSSDMFPWASEYVITDLPNADKIIKQLQHLGMLAQQYDQRLTFHPGQFNVLVSPDERIVRNTIKELEFHAQVMDYMNLPQSVYAKINIHLGGAYGDKVAAMQRFCLNFKKLSSGLQSRLTVENDDKETMYTVQDLYEGIYQKIKVPIVFDTLHYECNPGYQTMQEAFVQAYETWPDDIEPIIHVSESRQKQDPSAIKRAHADYITTCVDTYGKKVSIMIEAKAKELAVMKYRDLCFL